MSRTYAEEKYTCPDDCVQSGCPGHTINIVENTDMLVISGDQIGGVIYLNYKQFRAISKALKKIGSFDWFTQENTDEDTTYKFMSISNSELAKKKPAGKYATCKRCGEKHLIRMEKKKMPDGTYKEDGLIGYVECNDGQIYLASINGKVL